MVGSGAGAGVGRRRRPAWGGVDGFDGILRRGTGGSRRARHHAWPVTRAGRKLGARPDRADCRRSRSGAAPPVDLFRTLRRGATHGARPAPPLQAGRADRRLGAEPARMGHARVRRGAGGHGAGHRQSRFQGQRSRICAEAIPFGRRVRRQFLPRQSDAGDGARGCAALPGTSGDHLLRRLGGLHRRRRRRAASRCPMSSRPIP